MVCSPFVYDSNEKENTIDDNFILKNVMKIRKFSQIVKECYSNFVFQILFYIYAPTEKDREIANLMVLSFFN